MQIINNQPFDGIKKEIGVCVKQFTLEKRNSAFRVIEVHILRILGADKFFLYYRYIHSDLFRVVHYMKEKDFVNWLFLEPREFKHQNGQSIFQILNYPDIVSLIAT